MLKRTTLFSQEYEHPNALGTDGASECYKAVLLSRYVEIPMSRTHSLMAKLCVPHDKDYGESHEFCYQLGKPNNYIC